MRIVVTCTLALLIVSFLDTAHARLPAPPTLQEAKALVERVRGEAAGQTRPETRQRLADQVAAVPGPVDRIRSGAGIILILRGYPWEGLFFLSESALADFERPDVLNNMGLVLTLIREQNKAERLLLYTTHQWPAFHPAWTNLARLYFDMGEYDNARACLDQTRKAAPGSEEAEEVAARMAVERRDMAGAADHAVRLSTLDPGNPMIPEILSRVPEEHVVNALRGRAAAVPMPACYVELEPVMDDYEAFVLDELRRGYWQRTSKMFVRIGGEIKYQSTQLPPEVYNQLPANIKAALKSRGAGPGKELSVLAPTGSRTHYPLLSIYFDRYRKAYQRDLGRLFRSGPVVAIYREEQSRQRRISREYKEALKAGGDPRMARDRWCRQSIGSLSTAHRGYLGGLLEARTEANRLTRRFWLRTASLIAMVPEAHRGAEIGSLKRVAALSSLHYTAAVTKWYALGYMAVATDRQAAFTDAASLHAAFTTREMDSILAREAARDAFDWDLEDGEAPWWTQEPEAWRGLNLGFFSVKVQGDSVSVSIGEGTIGDASYDWEEHEFTMGIGVGAALPPLGPIPSGASGKVMGVVRLGGPMGAALGVRENVQLSLGTPVSGYDLDVVDEYQWLIAAGRIPSGS